jgi:hypothetical protein
VIPGGRGRGGIESGMLDGQCIRARVVSRNGEQKEITNETFVQVSCNPGGDADDLSLGALWRA